MKDVENIKNDKTSKNEKNSKATKINKVNEKMMRALSGDRPEIYDIHINRPGSDGTEMRVTSYTLEEVVEAEKMFRRTFQDALKQDPDLALHIVKKPKDGSQTVSVNDQVTSQLENGFEKLTVETAVTPFGKAYADKKSRAKATEQAVMAQILHDMTNPRYDFFYQDKNTLIRIPAPKKSPERIKQENALAQEKKLRQEKKNKISAVKDRIFADIENNAPAIDDDLEIMGLSFNLPENYFFPMNLSVSENDLSEEEQNLAAEEKQKVLDERKKKLQSEIEAKDLSDEGRYRCAEENRE